MRSNECGNQSCPCHEPDVNAADENIPITALEPVEKTLQKEGVCETQAIYKQFHSAKEYIVPATMGGKQTAVKLKATDVAQAVGREPQFSLEARSGFSNVQTLRQRGHIAQLPKKALQFRH